MNETEEFRAEAVAHISAGFDIPPHILCPDGIQVHSTEGADESEGIKRMISEYDIRARTYSSDLSPDPRPFVGDAMHWIYEEGVIL